MSTDPMLQTRADYAQIIDHIGVKDSPVGIDVALTHAIIIEYLQQITDRLDGLESRMKNQS